MTAYDINTICTALIALFSFLLEFFFLNNKEAFSGYKKINHNILLISLGGLLFSVIPSMYKLTYGFDGLSVCSFILVILLFFFILSIFYFINFYLKTNNNFLLKITLYCSFFSA